MKKFRVLILTIVCVLAIGLVSCGESKDKTESKIMYKVTRISTNSSVGAKSDTSNEAIKTIKGYPEYKEIIDQGDAALKAMLNQFENESGLGDKTEFIMAVACADLLNEDLQNRIWQTGREWYDTYKNK
ncbi:MAG: hypothetical protein ACRC2K_04265 [Clostridium sp.]